MSSMRIIAIGDLHGSNDWKEIVDSQDFDKVVFMGDYFDTFDPIPAAGQMHNFEKILDYKRENMDKAVLLVGNHDFHYMRGIIDAYSGYQHKWAMYIQAWIHKALDEDLMQMCYIYDKFLFTHAGVTETWLANQDYEYYDLREFLDNMEEFINDLFKYTPRVFGFTSGVNRSIYGDDICQTPIWVRPKSLIRDRIDGYTQIVGHTVQKNIVLGGKVVFIDTISTSGAYLLIDDREMSVLKLK